MLGNALKEYLKAINIDINEEAAERFDLYLSELINWNTKINLTAIKEPDAIIIKHFYDSILGMAIPLWNGKGKLLDIGTGAGFPGIPLKILNPELDVVLVDSLHKRVKFLDNLIDKLKLNNITAIHGRAEEIGRDETHRESYEWVVSRAVARLPVLAEYCLPLVKKGGKFLAYKGPEGETECQMGEKSVKILGGAVEKIYSFHLPMECGERNIIVISKKARTPDQYPRKAGIPEKKPM